MYTDERIPCPGGLDYRIPTGDCLGDWEIEDVEKDNGGLVKYVAPGPKTYCILAPNGKGTIKLKGACLKLAHSQLINFDTMKEMVVNGTGKNLPQFTINYKVGKGASSETFLKLINFNIAHVKGTYNEEEYRAYPYGYQE
jgi:hypothetical protein